jgi:hypothetical protein
MQPRVSRMPPAQRCPPARVPRARCRRMGRTVRLRLRALACRTIARAHVAPSRLGLAAQVQPAVRERGAARRARAARAHLLHGPIRRVPLNTHARSSPHARTRAVKRTHGHARAHMRARALARACTHSETRCAHAGCARRGAPRAALCRYVRIFGHDYIVRQRSPWKVRQRAQRRLVRACVRAQLAALGACLRA